MANLKDYFAKFKEEFNLKCFIIEALLLIVILSLDLISKEYISSFLTTQPNMTHPFIDGFMNLVYVKNYGASFGIFNGKTNFLIAFVIISLILLMLIWIFSRTQPIPVKLSLIFLIAGGIGNLVDRIAFGYVRDFLHFTFFEFPVFNIADSFIVIGTFLLIFYLIYSLIVEVVNKKKGNNNA